MPVAQGEGSGRGASRCHALCRVSGTQRASHSVVGAQCAVAVCNLRRVWCTGVRQATGAFPHGWWIGGLQRRGYHGRASGKASLRSQQLALQGPIILRRALGHQCRGRQYAWGPVAEPERGLTPPPPSERGKARRDRGTDQVSLSDVTRSTRIEDLWMLCPTPTGALRT